MRDVYTCIRRIECDLPITVEEAQAVREHLETHNRKAFWPVFGWIVIAPIGFVALSVLLALASKAIF